MPQEPIRNADLHLLKASPKRVRLLSYLLDRTSDLLHLRRLLKKLRPDIVHAHYATTYGFLGALLHFHPLVVTAWGSDILAAPRRSLAERWMVKCALRKADLMTCDAEHMSKEMRRLGARSANIAIIRFGVDTQKFSPQMRQRLAIGARNPPTIISTRLLDPLYDVESLIRCAPYVLAEIPSARFLIAGEGSDEQRLKELARALGVSRRTIFLGWLTNSELLRHLSSADVYVSTSLSDAGIAASTAEAMACGLPVIVTDVAENSEWVRDGAEGFVVPTRDPKALAEKILYLLKNRDMAAKFGNSGRQVIEERNDYHREMAKMETLYEQLVRRRAR
jgi:glycosyltransferase involved in cell wall biosynthesis